MSNLAEAQRTAHLGEDEPAPPEPGPIPVLRAIDRALARVEGVAVTFFLFVLILVGVFGALTRKFAPPSPFWADEVVRYSVFFIGLVGAALAAQSDRLFNIDMFTRAFRPRGRLIIRILSAAFTIVICYLFLTGSLTLRTLALMDEKGEILDPRWGVLSLPVAMVLIGLHMALHIIIDVYYLGTGRTPPEFEIPTVPKT
jgi:TRAP-type C4-dicarboxylate transport system permease small subunit